MADVDFDLGEDCDNKSANNKSNKASSKQQTNLSTTTNILESMKKNDQFIGDLLAPLEKRLGIKFNKFDKPKDPKFEEPKKKKNLKLKLKQAERKQTKLAKLDPEKAKEVQWKNVLEKAQGIKNKDDPALIKKAIKNKSKKKIQNKKKWAERAEKNQKAKEIREKRKKQRIQKSKEGKKGVKKN